MSKNFIIVFYILCSLLSGQVTASQATPLIQPYELMIIDAAVPDKAKFYQQLPRNSKVVELSDGANGTAQLLDVLASQQQLSALHIVSHGGDGELLLGKQRLDLTVLNQQQAQFKALRQIFTVDADVILYGCELAQSVKGKRFVEQFAHLLDVDVAASDDKTGALSQGGDWHFEYQTGVIQSQPIIAANYGHVLPVDEMIPLADGGNVSYDLINGRFDSTIDGVNYYVEARHGWFFNTPYDALTDAANHTGGDQLISLSGANASTPDDVVFVFSAPVDLTSLGVFYTSHFSNSQYIVADLTPGSTNTPISITDSEIDNAGNGFDSSTVSFNWNNVTSFSFTRTGGTQAGSIADAFIGVDRLNASVAVSDTSPPVVSSSVLAGSTQPANATSILFNIAFDEEANNITVDDFDITTVSGTASGTIASVNSSTTSSGGVSVTVNPISGAGVLRLDVKSNTNIVDDLGNGNNTNGFVAPFTSGATHTVDLVAPTITNVSIANSPHKVGDTVAVTITVNSDADSYTLEASSVAGRSLSNLTKVNNTTYTAEFVITDGSADVAAANDIAVSVMLSDTATNTSSEYNTVISQPLDAIYANLPEISLAVSSASMAEDDPAVTMTASLGGSLNNLWPVAINVSLTYSGTATPIVDYSKTDNITISAYSNAATGSLQAVVDTLYDAPTSETILATITSVSVGTINPFLNLIAVSIVDRQTAPRVVLAVSDAYMAENGGASTITAALSYPTYENVTVQLAYSGTANVGGTDYGAASALIVIPAGGISADTSVTAIDDALEEDFETVIVDINSVTGGGATESSTQQQIIRIVDNDDTTAPSITSITVPANGTYIAGQTLRFTVNFDETVLVTNAPFLSLNIGGTNKLPSFVTGSGSTAVVFDYQVEAGLTADGINLLSLTANPNSIRDDAGNDAILTLSGVGDLSGINVDSVLPSVSSVTSLSLDEAYRANSDILLLINFNEEVTVTGTPRLLLETGTTDRYATMLDFSGGSGTTQLRFGYTVQAGDNSSDLDYVSTSALELNGGTITDNANNNAVLTLAAPGATNSLGANKAIIIDTVKPTLIISSDDATLKVGETTTVRFALSEDSDNFGLSDVIVTGGNWTSFIGTGSNRTGTFIPADNFDGDATFNVAGNEFTDLAGNNNTIASQHTISINTARPSITISSDGSPLKAGETTTISFTLSEVSTDFTVADVTVVDGNITNFTGSGTAYSALFTPLAESVGNATIDVAQNTFTDSAANTNTASNQLSISIDTARPSITISSDESALKFGQTTSIDFLLSEASTTFTSGDVIVDGGAVTNFSGSSISYSATFTPDTNSTSAASISVTLDSFIDAAGNGNTSSNILPLTVDTLRPSIVIASDGSPLKAGETTTIDFTLSEVSTDFTVADVTVVDGNITNFTGSGTAYSALFTPLAESVGNATIDVAQNTFTDSATNTNTASNQLSISIDTARPSITISSDESALKFGQTTSIYFLLSEASTTFTSGDVIVDGGAVTNFSGSSISYSATFTPDTNSTSAASISVTLDSFIDAAGNGNTSSNILPLTVDTLRPSIVIASDGSPLKAGETTTIDFTLSEVSTDFTVADVTVVDGNITNFTGSGTAYSALFTPLAESVGNATIDVAQNTFTDSATNINTAAIQLAISINTVRPSVSIASDDEALASGQTTIVNFTLSETSTDFTVSDVTVSGGTLSNFAGSGSAYSATFTPNADFTGDATFDIALEQFVNAATNSNNQATQHVISIDTQAPDGHSVTIDQSQINTNNQLALSFTFADAEVGATFDWQISDGVSESTTVDGNGVLSNANQQITGIDVSSLADETLTLSVMLFDSVGNSAPIVKDTVDKLIALAPVAMDDNFSTDEDTAKMFNLLTNDTDANNDIVAASAQIKTQPSKGVVTISNGVVTYTPNTDLFGSDTFSYTVKDALLQESSAAVVTVTINALNDAPVAADLVINIDEDSVSTPLNARTTATDVEDNIPTGDLTLVNQPQSGQVVIDQQLGTFVYTANNDVTGTDSFSYQINDSEGLVSNTATVNVNIGSVNDAPIANPDSIIFDEDNTGLLDVLSNDFDIEDISFSSSSINLENQGQGAGNYSFATVTVDTNGQLSIVPTADINGSFSFNYSITDSEQAISQAAIVSLTINSVNDAPVAQDNAAQLLEGGEFEVNVLGNDSDVDAGDSFDLTSVLVVTAASNGQTQVNAQGAIVYTPNANYFGEDSFTYTVQDLAGATSNIANVTMMVTAVNDAPIVTGQAVRVDEDNSIEIILVATDIDSGDLTYQITETVTHGSLEQLDVDRWIYMPEADYVGIDSFQFTANDGVLDSTLAEVSITIEAVNDAPIANALTVSADEDTMVNITLEGSDVDSSELSYQIDMQPVNGELQLTGSQVTYQPAANYYGEDSFSYQVSDGTLDSVVATVVITINSVNDMPVLSGVPITSVDEDSSYLFTPVASDDDTGDMFTFSINNQPSWAGFESTSGALSGVPANGDVGQYAGIVISVSDGTQTVALPAFSITVNNVNDAPVISGSPATTVAEDEEYSFTPLVVDVDSTVVSFSIANQPSWASFDSVTGRLAGTPTNDDVGQYSGIVISVSDGQFSDALQTFSITVSNVNDAPVISGSPATTVAEDEVYSFAPLVVDVDSTVFSFSIANQPSWASFDSVTGRLAGTPTNDDVGQYSGIVISVSDGQFSDALQTFSILVSNVNDAPVISGSPGTTVAEDDEYSFAPLVVDVDSTVFSFSIVNQPSWASFDSVTGRLAGTPTNDDVGQYSGIVISVSDGQFSDALQTFSILVSNVNDAPVISGSPEVSVDQDKPYLFTPTADDVDGDDLSFTINNQPSWTTFDTVTGTLSGTPTNQDVGQYAGIVISVSDGMETVALPAFSITVNKVNAAPTINGSPEVSVGQDKPYLFTPTADDVDGDDLSFTINNQPSWTTFDTVTGTLSGTPTNQDVGEYAGIVISVFDGSETTSLPSFSITVNNVNDAPVANDDSYVLDQVTDNIYLLDVLANDSDVDQDELSLDWVSSSAEVSIVEQQIKLVTSTIGTFDIQYGLTDGKGGNARASVVVMITSSAENGPTVTAPDDIELNASGLFTQVNLGVALAEDNSGSALPVIFENETDQFPAGVNTVYWSTEDAQGNMAQDTQTVTIHPLLSIELNGQTTEGSQQNVMIYLSGESPVYPVVIPYTVTGSADSDDHDLESGELVINSGRQGVIEFSVFADQINEGDETIIIALDNTLNVSNNASHQLTISENNLAPKVNLVLRSNGEPSSQLARLSGLASVTSEVFDSNQADSHSYFWTAEQDNLSGLVLDQQDRAQLSFDPEQLTAGIYQLNLTVEDNGSMPLSVTNSLYFEVVESQPVLGNGDSDGDLIPDIQEGYADQDGDGIPDYLDAIGKCNVLQQRAGIADSFLIESQSGVCLRKGILVANNQTGGAELLKSELVEDEQANNIGGVFEFVATGLSDIGQSYEFVLPQRLPIPIDAVYRKYSAQLGWTDFVIDSANSVSSSPGVPGYCPVPGDSSWVVGLQEGDWCVQLTIEDGGPNDQSGFANGTIIDPGGVATRAITNSAPIVTDIYLTIALNETKMIDVAGEATDVDSDQITLNFADVLLGGIEVVNNQLVYTPEENHFGQDFVTYGLSDGQGGTASAKVFINIINGQAPVAENYVANTDNLTSITLSVLSNDVDADGDAISLTSAIATFGSVTLNDDDTLTYAPLSGFVGVDIVNYVISDSTGLTSSARVEVNVTNAVSTAIPPRRSSGSISLLMIYLLISSVWLRRYRVNNKYQ